MGKNTGILKGLAHDFAWHLEFQIWHGKYQDSFSSNFETNALEMKGYFDKEIVDFFKKRLPKSFDFSKIEEIIIQIKRSMTAINIQIKIKYNSKEIEYKCKSSIA